MYSGNTLYYGILINYSELLNINFIEYKDYEDYNDYIDNIDNMLSEKYIFIGLYRKPCCSFNIKEDKLILGIELGSLVAQNRTYIKKYNSIIDYHKYFTEQINKSKRKYETNETRIKNLKAYLPTAVKLASKYNAQ